MSLVPPESIQSRYAAWSWTVTSGWPGVSTVWRLTEPGTGRAEFMKVVRAGHYPTVRAEAERTRWARPFLAVPAVIDSGSDGTVDWLVTSELEGVDARLHPLIADPSTLVPILARGLAAFHAAAPVATCPFVFDAQVALAHVHQRVADGIATTADLHPEHAHLTIDGALAELHRLTPATEELVVCHGDYCFPNVLLDDAGAVTGFIDLGELGVADRWWDVAIGAWSTTWNVGPGWEELFYESYGTDPDPDRIAFYRLLYDLAS